MHSHVTCLAKAHILQGDNSCDQVLGCKVIQGGLRLWTFTCSLLVSTAVQVGSVKVQVTLGGCCILKWAGWRQCVHLGAC